MGRRSKNHGAAQYGENAIASIATGEYADAVYASASIVRFGWRADECADASIATLRRTNALQHNLCCSAL